MCFTVDGWFNHVEASKISPTYSGRYPGPFTNSFGLGIPFFLCLGFGKSRVSSQDMWTKYGRIIETSYLDVRLEFSKWLVNGL